MAPRVLVPLLVLVLVSVSAPSVLGEDGALYDGWEHQLHDCRNDWGPDSDGTPEASGHDIVAVDMREGPIPNGTGTGFGVRLTLEDGFSGEPSEGEELVELINLSIDRGDRIEHANVIFTTQDNDRFTVDSHAYPDDVVHRTNLGDGRFYVAAWFNHHRFGVSDGDTVVANHVIGFHIEDDSNAYTRDYAVGGYTDPDTGTRAGGCTDLTDPERYENGHGYTIQETPGPLPEPDFTAEPETPAPGEQVTFTDRSTDPNDQVESWKWYFDDGNTSTQQNTTHSYEEPGRYHVALVVTDAEGNRNWTRQAVHVELPELRAAFQVTPSSPTVDQLVDFNGTETVSGANQTYRWTLGDGTTASGRNVTHRYDEPGTYEITLNVTDEHGRSDEAMASLTVSAPENSTSNGTTNGDTDQAGENDTNRTAEGGGADEGNQTEPTDDNRPPQVRIAAPGSVRAGEVVTLDSRSTDLDGEITSRQWNLGDGTASQASTVEHTFSRAGNYTITLTVVDDDGAEVSGQHHIEVDPSREPTNRIDDIEPSDHVSENTSDARNGTPVASTLVVLGSLVTAALRRR